MLCWSVSVLRERKAARQSGGTATTATRRPHEHSPHRSKVWSFCNTLRDDGVGYGDYLEQLTFLIFLKMADEYSQAPYNRNVDIPAAYNWKSLQSKRGAELEVHYVSLLQKLGSKPGMLGQIFT